MRSPTNTAGTAPAQRRSRMGPAPSGPNGLTRDQLLATRVDKIERPQVLATLAELGYAQDGTGLRELLLDLASGRAKLTTAA